MNGNIDMHVWISESVGNADCKNRNGIHIFYFQGGNCYYSDVWDTLSNRESL